MAFFGMRNDLLRRVGTLGRASLIRHSDPNPTGEKTQNGAFHLKPNVPPTKPSFFRSKQNCSVARKLGSRSKYV